MKLPRAPPPVHGRQGPGQHRGIGDLFRILGRPGSSPVLNPGHRLHQQRPAHGCQPVVKGLGRLVGLNVRGGLGNDIPRVQLRSHVHYGDAGLLLPVENGPVDGGRAAIFGQQRGVHIDTAQGRQGKHLLRQHPAIGRRHNQLGIQFTQLLQGGSVPQGDRLEHRDAARLGTDLHRCGLKLVLVSAHRLVRLAEHAANLVPR